MNRRLPTTQSWWSAEDRAVVLAVCEELHPVSVLEFGPGSSTLALLDGKVRTIDACEDNPEWAAVAEERLAGNYPERVRVVRYVWSEPLQIPELAGATYDLALIDGPRKTMNRLACAAYAFLRCAAVLAPMETGHRDYHRALSVIGLAHGRTLRVIDSGPPSGGFLLFT